MAKAKYNYRHQQAREAALKALVDGTPCHFCGRPMYRANARQLHLDHDLTGTTYRGLAHADCNILDGARRGGLATARRRHPLAARRSSRDW